MKRRHFLGRSIALATMLSGSFARAASKSAVGPGTPGWPTDAEWADLNRAVNGHLSPVDLPDLDDPAVRRLIRNPFYLGNQPGLTQSSGWLDAWRSAPSAYVVAPESAADVAATLRFASPASTAFLSSSGAAVTAIPVAPMRWVPCSSGRDT